MKFFLLLILILASNFSIAQMSDNDAIVKMTEWIESPLEFGEKPTQIKVLDNQVLDWPSDTEEKAFLVEYFIKNKKYIGFTGPITWSFIGIDYDKLSKEELYNLYTGWYICFISSQSQIKESPSTTQNRQVLTDKLEKSGYTDIDIMQELNIAGDTFFEIKAKKDGSEKVLVATIESLIIYPINTILPMYKAIGELWDPLNKR